jgi:hypothetical protein
MCGALHMRTETKGDDNNLGARFVEGRTTIGH